MRRFTELYFDLDATTRTAEKRDALERYFRDAPPRDAAWALAYFAGRRPRRAVSPAELRAACEAVTGCPAWLINESYEQVGDLSETIALILEALAPAEVSRGPACAAAPALADIIERWIIPMAGMTPGERRETLTNAWRTLDTRERLVFHKLVGGGFRVGAQRRLVVRALAAIAGVEPAVMEHRLAGPWRPTADDLGALLSEAGTERDADAPYPFFLATDMRQRAPAQRAPETLGKPSEFLAEWKWDGIRAQLTRRAGRCALWSRGDEPVGRSFPEILALGALLPDGVAIDGELLAWEGDRPLPFADLQRRLNRTTRQPMLFDDVPVAFIAYDLLEHGAVDLRSRPIDERLDRLRSVVEHVGDDALRLSPPIPFAEWSELARERARARTLGVEGVMLKRRGSPYRAGRVRGDWWKWKADPFAIDAVLIAAQRGSGKRASLFTDYTFGVWHDGSLVPVAKAYSGLTDREIDRVDAFIRRHTLSRAGPYREVEPELVFEIAFEGAHASDRHRSGIALRFPRIERWRHDKAPSDADTLDDLRRIADGTAP